MTPRKAILCANCPWRCSSPKAGGMRLGVVQGIIDPDDVGREQRGLYGNLREMLREANGIELDSPEDEEIL